MSDQPKKEKTYRRGPYRVTAKPGVVGFNGIIHKTGDVVDETTVPVANLKAWLRFGQVEEVAEEKAEGRSQKEESKKGKS